MESNQQELSPPPQIPLSEMAKIGFWILDVLRTQGLSFLLLGLAVWHLQKQNIELSQAIMQCQSEKYEALINVVSANTEALKTITNGTEKKKK